MTKSELMENILERPAMFLGHASVVKMQSFIEGFAFANIVEKKTEKDLLYDGFGEWVIKRFKVGQYSWSSVITMVGISEARAFEIARELWKEYKEKFGPTTNDE